MKKLNLANNSLSDISPLSVLSNLEILDLRNNLIVDTSSLSHLLSLQKIDLSGNRICTVSALSGLKPLSMLHSLYIKKNPFTQLDLGFSDSVFEYLPTIQILDDYAREDMSDLYIPPMSPQFQVGKTRAALSPRENSMTLQDTSFSLDASTVQPERKFDSQNDIQSVELLSVQLMSMEKVCDLQEKVLGETLASMGSLPSSSKSMTSTYGGTSLDPSLIYQLLQLWRKKTLESLTKQGLLANQLKNQEKMREKMCNELQAKVVAAERISEGWKERCAAAVAQNSVSRLQLSQAQQRLTRAEESCAQGKRIVTSDQKAILNMKSSLELLQERFSKDWLNSQVNLMKSSERLKEMDARLCVAAERIKFSSALVAQKELQLRNSAAALEADKRLWVISIDPRERSNEAGRSNGDNDKENASLKPPILQPEVEIMIRDLFRQLDTKNTGLVSVKLIYDVLFSNWDIVQNESKKYDGQARSSAANFSDASEVVDMMKHHLGLNCLERLKAELLRASENINSKMQRDCASRSRNTSNTTFEPQLAFSHDSQASFSDAAEHVDTSYDTRHDPSCDGRITWGEFLLMLIPRSIEERPLENLKRDKTVGMLHMNLTTREKKGLVEAGVLEDESSTLLSLDKIKDSGT